MKNDDSRRAASADVAVRPIMARSFARFGRAKSLAISQRWANGNWRRWHALKGRALLVLRRVRTAHRCRVCRVRETHRSTWCVSQTRHIRYGLALPRREVGVGFDAEGELGQQVGGLVDVVERDHLDRAVHVAVGDADEAGRDAAAGELDRVGVGAGAAAARAPLDGDVWPSRPPCGADRRRAGSCSARDRSPGRRRA